MPANLHEILEDLGIDYQGESHGRTGWLQVDCPFCGNVSSKGGIKKYLGISLVTGASSCWRCGKHSTAAALAMLSGGNTKAIAARLDNVPHQAAELRKSGRYRPPKGLGPMGPGHRAYLARRGFNPDEIAELWGVQGLGQVPALAWRLWIPITYHNQPVSWTTRSIRKSDKLRYISAGHEQEAIPHKELLYGADYCTHTAIVHEGPVDVWATGPGAVATCGLEVSDAQVKALARFPRRVVCFDGTRLAQRRARRLADMLSVFPGETFSVELETGDDAAEADPAELRELREYLK